MHTLVYGAGGVGLGLGSFLLAAGHDVAFLGRDDTVAALRARGLERSGVFGEHRAPAQRLRAATRLGELAGRSFDQVLVTTKSFDSEAAARALAEQPALVGAAEVVLCQNGWGNAELFAKQLPAPRIWNARVITGFRRPEPHRVEVTAHAEPVRIGSLFGESAARMAPLCDALARGGLPAEPCERIADELWAKLLYNGCLNPACAILGIPYGALGASAPGRSLIAALAHEAFAVMRAAGFRARWESADDFLADFYARLLPTTAQHESSTLQDLRGGRRTEIDALNGAVVRLGDAHGVATPVNRALVAMVKLLEERGRAARVTACERPA